MNSVLEKANQEEYAAANVSFSHWWRDSHPSTTKKQLQHENNATIWPIFNCDVTEVGVLLHYLVLKVGVL